MKRDLALSRRRKPAGAFSAVMTMGLLASGAAACASDKAPETASTPSASASTPTASPPTSTAPEVSATPEPAVSAGTQVIVSCHDEEELNELTVYDASSGSVLDSFSVPLQLDGEYTTSEGAVVFNQHSEETNDCSFQNFGPNFATVPGVASFPDGRQAPASVSLSDSSLTFAGPVPSAGTGFSAAEPSKVMDALYTADGKLWWVELPPGNETYIVKNEDGQSQEYPTMNDGSFGDVTAFSLTSDGGWMVHVNYASFYNYRVPSGELLSSEDITPAFWNYYTGGEELLPETQYTIGLGRYRSDGNSIAFWAQPPGGTDNTLFVVPATGGEPKEVVAAAPDNGVVYYGAYR